MAKPLSDFSGLHCAARIITRTSSSALATAKAWSSSSIMQARLRIFVPRAVRDDAGDGAMPLIDYRLVFHADDSCVTVGSDCVSSRLACVTLTLMDAKRHPASVLTNVSV